MARERRQFSDEFKREAVRGRPDNGEARPDCPPALRVSDPDALRWVGLRAGPLHKEASESGTDDQGHQGHHDDCPTH